MTTELLIWLIPLPPALAFFLIVLFTNKSKTASHTLAVGAAFLSWLGAMIVFVRALGVEHLAAHPFKSAIDWLPTGESYLRIGVLIDPLSAIVLFFVAWCVLMIFVYSVGYHNYGQPAGDHDHAGLPPHGATVHGHAAPSVEPMYSRFFAFIGLFAFGMLTLVVSDNVLTMFVGWEIMGLCSYLLIGFWYGKESARNAAIKAFMTTRIGDVFMLLGIAFLYSVTGSLSFDKIFSEEVLHALASVPTGIFGLSAAGLIGLLLFIGTIGKSAQFPLHVWLPDAMEGPTPVSAMIHAATMVSAGVYAVIRMFPILSLDERTMGFVAFIGAFTALFAATIAVAQNDIKRVLAYSTISQLGFMIAALGIGAYVAATFHLVTHAFFKALLFLGSGSVIHGMEHGVLHTGNHKVDPQDMFNMGGLRKKMPKTFWTFLIGGFALSGFPLVTAGFWSKDEILADAWAHGHVIVFATLAFAAFLTAFYTMRQITLTFFGEPRTEEAKHAHETPWTMTTPLIILSVFAIGFGWVGMPHWITGGIVPNWFHEFTGSMLHEHAEELAFNIVPLATSLLVALGGLAAGYFVYRNVKSPAEDKLQIPVLKNKWYVDELYNVVFIKPAVWFSEVFVSQWMDKGLIDGILHLFGPATSGVGSGIRNYFDLPVINRFFGDGSADATWWFGKNLRPIQTGRIQQYLLLTIVILFMVGGLLYFLLTA
ncbi:NADH-quinone oxidoreductase subunit L [Chloroflexi bacterium CFX5]|nr:NADH-quinone oxidoreductase subunit L [Chloroflexota bacterium]MDL1918998.1 NADH-quinone oxidoreductase subunit L [Chloroflexi bacterium CFX5]NUQ60415.1 NADH-quinone oxidoreductase subunit L [Anaerolineales bacterium]